MFVFSLVFDCIICVSQRQYWSLSDFAETECLVREAWLPQQDEEAGFFIIILIFKASSQIATRTDNFTLTESLGKRVYLCVRYGGRACKDKHAP